LFLKRLQNLHEFRVQEFIAADHMAGLERVVVAGDAAMAANMCRDTLLAKW